MTGYCVWPRCDARFVEVRPGVNDWLVTIATPVDHEHVAGPLPASSEAGRDGPWLESALDLVELEEHEMYLAEVEALRRLRTVASLVVALDDGPVDEYFQQAWPSVMTILRHRLEELEQIRPRA